MDCFNYYNFRIRITRCSNDGILCSSPQARILYRLRNVLLRLRHSNQPEELTQGESFEINTNSKQHHALNSLLRKELIYSFPCNIIINFEIKLLRMKFQVPFPYGLRSSLDPLSISQSDKDFDNLNKK